MYGYEQMDLPPDTVEAVAETYTGYGFWCDHPDEDDERTSADPRARALVGASSYTIGASFYALINPFAARVVFAAAAHAYRRLGLGYAAVPAICAGDGDLLNDLWNGVLSSEGASFDVPQLVALALLKRWASERGMDVPVSTEQVPALILLDRYDALEVGIARLPLYLYGSMEPLRDGELFSRWAERVGQARINRYQWQMMTSSFIPVDPEILAAAALAVEASGRRDEGRDRDRQIGRTSGLNALDGIARLPIEIARRMGEVPLEKLPTEVLSRLDEDTRFA